MRIWHEQLIPKLCRQHLLAMWREGLGAYKIITENKKGYRNHPAVKEFEVNTLLLAMRLMATRNEMVERGYHPKEFTFLNKFFTSNNKYQPWQTLDQQIEILKQKKCQCEVRE